MVIIKIKRDTYGSKTNYLEHALRYVGDPKKNKYLAGFGVDPYDLNNCYKQMQTVKEYYHKTGDNPMVHFIISFGDNVKKEWQAINKSYEIARAFKDEYQVLWCVHQKTRGDSKYHIHLIVNSVSLADGKLINTSPEFMENFKTYVGEIVGDECRYKFASLQSTDDID